jgi:molybdopterin-dependent oxidoreductase alpha subunit
MSKKDASLTPEEFNNIKITDPAQYAAGTAALKKSFAHILREMGPARGVKILNKLNQKNGIDCPGCAWPDPDAKRSFMAEYCENGVKAIAEEATVKKVDEDFFKKNSIDELGDKDDFFLGKTGRLTQPMVIRKGESHYSKISWNKAFDIVSKELNALPSPNDSIFYTSGRTSNEAAFAYQLMVRKLGTNNLPDCSNMCHESSGAGLSNTVGIGKGSVTLEDLYCADIILVIGQNPGTNHPRMLSALKKNKENGGTIISINPLPEAGLINFKDPQEISGLIGKGSKLADLHIPVTINGDLAFLKAVMQLLFKEEERSRNILDLDFIKSKTSGFQEFKDNLLNENLNTLVRQSGVDLSLIEQTSQLIIENPNMIICWAMGLTQHKNGVGNIQEVVNLLLMRGSIGKKGAGTCPVRGHSNVQGDRTMGIWEKPPTSFLDKLDEVFEFSSPRKHGHDVVSAIESMNEKANQVFFAMGGNFLSAAPDTEYTAQALRNCKLTVQVSTKLNRSHLVHGEIGLILPCLGRTEIDLQDQGSQFVSVENSMGVVHSSQGRLAPASNLLKSEVSIVCELAEKLFPEDKYWTKMRDDYDVIREFIEAVIPGFDNYNERIRIPEGFYLPNNARTGDFSVTNTGKANFTVNELPVHDLKAEEYLMMTIRTHDQYNTTIYGMDDRYRGIYGERRVILMNQQDMNERGFSNLEVVNLKSHFNGETREANLFKVVTYPIPRNCTATYFPETNVLVPIGLKADKSHTPASKSIVITIEKTS